MSNPISDEHFLLLFLQLFSSLLFVPLPVFSLYQLVHLILPIFLFILHPKFSLFGFCRVLEVFSLELPCIASNSCLYPRDTVSRMMRMFHCKKVSDFLFRTNVFFLSHSIVSAEIHCNFLSFSFGWNGKKAREKLAQSGGQKIHDAIHFNPKLLLLSHSHYSY